MQKIFGLIVLLVSSISGAATPAHWVMPLFSDRNSLHCTGVLISPRTVLTARHCLDEGPLYLKEQLDSQHRIGINRIDRDLDKPWLFPLYDIALLHLDRDIPRPSYPSLGRKAPSTGDILEGYGFGLRVDCRVAACTRLKKWTSRVQDVLEGQRLYGLFGATTIAGDSLCFGDSGGPVFAVNKGRYELIGLVSGQSPELYPGAGFCRFPQNLFTAVSSFRNGKLKMPETRLLSASSWEELCRKENPHDESWPLTQSLFFQIAAWRKGLNDANMQTALLTCKGMNELVQDYMNQEGKLTVKQDIPLQFGSLYASLQKLELAYAGSNELDQLKALPKLRELELLGLKDHTDLTVLLNNRMITQITLKHGRAMIGLPHILHGLQHLKFIELYDVELKEEDKKALCRNSGELQGRVNHLELASFCWLFSS